MDIKPANIFIDFNGDFLLGDFGSIRKVDELIGSTTPTFFPHDMTINKYATMQHDYWMLAMTIKDSISDSEMGEIGVASKFPIKQEVLIAIGNIDIAETRQLIHKLVSPDELN